MSGQKRKLLDSSANSSPKQPRSGESSAGDGTRRQSGSNVGHETEKSTEKYIRILLGRNTEDVQYRVYVYKPQKTVPIRRLTPKKQGPTDAFRTLLGMLKPYHIDTVPKPKATLVNIGSSRIDTEPATTVFRNIQFQAGDCTFANMTVDRGGDLCTGIYQQKLLRYIKEGLRQSFVERSIFNSNVTIEKQEGKNLKDSWQILEVDENFDQTIKGILRLYGKRIESNGNKSATKRKMHAQNEAAIAGKVAKVGVSVVPGGEGDLETDGDFEDTIEVVTDDEAEIEKFKEENRRIRNELKAEIPESHIFGGDSGYHFDEFELADLEDITKIKVRASDMINSIQVIYQSCEAGKHGYDLGLEDELILEEDERIITVHGTLGSDGIGISSLTFHTDYGRQKSFGKVGGEAFEFEMTDGCYLAAIKGYDAYGVGNKTNPAGHCQPLSAIGFIQKA